MSDAHDLHEIAYFTGSENPIFYSRELSVKLKCDFDLSYFPFDTQTCFIALTAGSKVRNFIELVGESVAFRGPRSLATFKVVNWNLETEMINPDIDIKVNVKLKRQITNHLLEIYMPSLFIIAIAQVSMMGIGPWTLVNIFLLR